MLIHIKQVRFHASEDPRFEAGIPDFMNGIQNFSIHFNHRKVDWRNPKMKSIQCLSINHGSRGDQVWGIHLSGYI